MYHGLNQLTRFPTSAEQRHPVAESYITSAPTLCVRNGWMLWLADMMVVMVEMIDSLVRTQEQAKPQNPSNQTENLQPLTLLCLLMQSS